MIEQFKEKHGDNAFEKLCEKLSGYNDDGELFDFNYGAITSTIHNDEGGLRLSDSCEVWSNDELINTNYEWETGGMFNMASLWSNANTCVEIGFEILQLMEVNGKTKGKDKNTEVEKIADGVLLMSNDKEINIAVKKDTAGQALSDTAVSDIYCEEKNGYLIYSGAAAAIPLFELSKVNAGVRDFIVSEESLRATLCGN